METYGLLSLIPPLVAVGLALWKKQLLPSIFFGILVGETILKKGNLFSAFFCSLDDALRIIGNKVNLEIILFCILVGSFMEIIKEANGFQGFIDWFENKKFFRGKKTVYPLTYLMGISIFIESWSSMLINGSVMKPLYAKLKISRQRLAYFIHTLSINFVAIVVINSWGAYYVSLLSTQEVENPLRVIIHSIPFNFYCLLSLLLVAVVMVTGMTIGPLRDAERAARKADENVELDDRIIQSSFKSGKKHIPAKASHMVFPTIVLVGTVIFGLYITGQGDLTRGSGSTAVFYAACVAILFSIFFFVAKKLFSFQEVLDVSFKGMGSLIPIGILLVLALTLGDVCKQLGTGNYIAALVKQNIPHFLLPAIVFGISCIISFATGTSYGTFAIMIPIAIPMAKVTGVSSSLMLGACISGGVFGDNSSPISDGSILAGMVTGVKTIDHVKTQLPYALISASLALSLFLLVGTFK